MRHLLAPALLVAATAAVTQPARVIDGDTLELAGEQIRLIGIDAPEESQLCQRDGRDWACGDQATAALGELVAGGRVRCDVLGRDRWQRALAVCFAGETDYPKRGLPGPSYEDEQLEAEQEQRGLWSGSFLPPWEWRRL